MDIITHSFYLKLHIQRSQNNSTNNTSITGWVLWKFTLKWSLGYKMREGEEAELGRSQINVMYVIGSYKTLASSAEIILMKYAHHRYYMLGQTNQTFTFLSYLVTRCGLHQKRHASGKVSLNLRLALKLSTEQSFLWCIVWVALLHVSHNLQQYDYWKQFGIIFIVLFGLKVYTSRYMQSNYCI